MLYATHSRSFPRWPSKANYRRHVRPGQYGTAFPVGPDLLLTNWHVVHRVADGTLAAGITAEFRFEDDRAGDLTQAEPIRCDPVIVA